MANGNNFRVIIEMEHVTNYCDEMSCMLNCYIDTEDCLVSFAL